MAGALTDGAALPSGTPTIAPPRLHLSTRILLLDFPKRTWWSRTQMLDGPPDQTALLKGGQVVFIANAELLQGRESNMSLISWHSSRQKRVPRSSSAAETRATAKGDDEAVDVRWCLKEGLFGQFHLQNWQTEALEIAAALEEDCRGVYDTLARFSSSCLGLKDKKSGLEALALKQSLFECGRMVRWSHSAAQLGVVVTEDSDIARAPWELFVRPGCRW